ncbi:MAG: hypothetical protein IJ512_04460 [Ruminococcus sp.]|nr:hypothetical protein [Ruminococcus sp.]
MIIVKRMLSGFTAAVTLACSITALAVPVSGADNWDGTVDTDWYNETDTIFTLETAEELAGFAQLVNDSVDTFAGKEVRLGADIVFNADADPDAWKQWENLPAANWVPIGREYASPFKGLFDGGGHTVSGLYSMVTEGAAGLFGFSGSGSQIWNVRLENSYVCSQDTYAGGICAYSNYAMLQYCINDADVSSEHYIGGGVLGVSMGGQTINCMNTGDVYGARAAGGVQGEQCARSYTSACYNGGTVTASENAGGITGRLESSNIEYSFNAGEISGGSVAGGIVGNSVGESYVTSSYHAGAVTCTLGVSGGISGDTDTNCENCYYLEGTAEGACADAGITVCSEDEMCEDAFAETLGKNFVSGGDSFPVLSWMNSEIVVKPPVTTESTTATTTTTTASSDDTQTATKTTVSTTGTTAAGTVKIWPINNVRHLSDIGDAVQLVIDGTESIPQWATMNKSVATVDSNGLVTAVGEGTVTIIATVDGEAVSIELTVGGTSSATTAKTTTTTTKTTTTTTKTTTTTTKTTTTTTKTTTTTTKTTTKATTTAKTTASTAKTTAKTTTKATTTAKTTASTAKTTSKTTTKTTATTTGATTTAVSMKAYARGDCNGDAVVNLADASAVLKYYAQNAAGITAAFDEDEKLNMLAGYAADVNRDDKLDLADASMILRYYAQCAAGLEASWSEDD